jgi:hypothetical protein
MKTKLVALILLATCGLAAGSFADGAPEASTQTIRIKAHGQAVAGVNIEINAQTVKIKARGETVAELKISTNRPVHIEGGIQQITDNHLRLIGVNGGVITVRIDCSGELPIMLRADEVEFVPERVSSMLLAAPM